MAKKRTAAKKGNPRAAAKAGDQALKPKLKFTPLPTNYTTNP